MASKRLRRAGGYRRLRLAHSGRQRRNVDPSGASQRAATPRPEPPIPPGAQIWLRGQDESDVVIMQHGTDLEGEVMYYIFIWSRHAKAWMPWMHVNYALVNLFKEELGYVLTET